MKTTITVITIFSAFAVAASNIIEQRNEQNNLDIVSPDDAKVHFFVLMVPESAVKALKKRAFQARQEEEATEIVTETGAYVGQIISGVLGGDVRPIFAGSASFIGEPDVQQGVSTILANVAPSINNVLKQWVSRVQTALGITTTPKPGSVVLSNGTSPSNGVVVGRPISAAEASRLTPQQILQLQQQGQQQQAQVSSYSPQTLPGSDVISGNDLYDTTTVEPLPLINFKPSDEDEESDYKKVVKI